MHDLNSPPLHSNLIFSFNLSLEDKNNYKEKAKEINSEPSEPLNDSKQLLKKICSLVGKYFEQLKVLKINTW